LNNINRQTHEAESLLRSWMLLSWSRNCLYWTWWFVVFTWSQHWTISEASWAQPFRV